MKIVIPYFLGAAAYIFNYNSIMRSNIFEVEINTLFINVSQNSYSESTAGLSFHLECIPVKITASLTCYISENSTSYFPTTKPKHQINDTFIPLPPLYEGIPFSIGFDSSGVTYIRFVEDTQVSSDWWRLLHLYGVIADQLNIGIDLSQINPLKKAKVILLRKAKEQSSIGDCPTDYDFSEELTIVQNERERFKLHSISNSTLLNFNEDKIQRIEKQRNMKKCALNNNIYLTMLLWKQFIPHSDYKRKKSGSKILIGKHYFLSRSGNQFVFYDKNRDVLGFLHEIISVKLRTVN